MFIFGNYVEAGALMSYGVDFPRMFQRAADDVVKIRNGAKPADLPIEQADKWRRITDRDSSLRGQGDRMRQGNVCLWHEGDIR